MSSRSKRANARENQSSNDPPALDPQPKPEIQPKKMTLKNITIQFENADGVPGTLTVPNGDLAKAQVNMEQAGALEIMSMIDMARAIARAINRVNSGGKAEADESIQDPT